MTQLTSRTITTVAAMAVLMAACTNGSGTDSTTAPPAAEVAPTTTTLVEAEDAATVSQDECLPDEICVTLTALESIGKELRLMLYAADAGEWPGRYRSLPTPGWVVSTRPDVPDTWPLRIRIPMTDNLFAISTNPIEGSEIGLAIATGVDSIMTVETTDARGFSDLTVQYEPGTALEFGTVAIALPAGDTCELNEYHPDCLSGSKFWEERLLGDENLVPGAVYLDVADLDGDSIPDIVTVGEPHFQNADLPLTDLKLGVYYMNRDLTVRETEIIDAWSEDDPTLYSPWGVNVIDHGGEPMIIVGLNIPGLAPLEEGKGDVLSYRRVDGAWERTAVITNADPTDTNYNAMIVVTCDIDNDGDEDLALSTAFGSSSVGSWMENTGVADAPWIPHLQDVTGPVDPDIRGVLAYKCTDLDGDGYPEVVYNGMFDIPDTNPPRFRGEIWLGLNPGPDGWDGPWEKVIIDDDNWASADMWFHDFDGDGGLDLVANQIFSSTVTLYRHPGADLTATWEAEIIIDELVSPSDMWLDDVDGDGLIDVVSADHTAHAGVWHRGLGDGAMSDGRGAAIFRNINMPGDFTMTDLDQDGDLDWIGVSMTLGQAFIVEQVAPPNGLVLTLALPDGFDAPITQLVVTLIEEVPLTGIPRAILAVIANEDGDGDGLLDVDQILSPGNDLVLAIDNVGLEGDFYVAAALYVEGGGQFQPVTGLDYLSYSKLLTFGDGPVEAAVELEVYEE